MRTPTVLCIALACWMGCSLAFAQDGKRVLVAFSDSLTDNGNFFNQISNRRAPTANVYFEGRATNAPGTWADQLPGLDQQLQVENFAFFGALACKFPNLPTPINIIPSLGEQIELFKRKWQTDKAYQQQYSGSELIPTIWIGHNDLQLMSTLPPEQAKQVPGQVVQCILNGTETLLASGHKTVVVGTLAPSDLTPKIILAATAFVSNSSSNSNVTVAGTLAAVKAIIQVVNDGIKLGLEELQGKYQDRKVVVWDVDTDLRSAITNFARLGFKFGGTSSCVVGGDSLLAIQPNSVCPDPNDFVFFDQFHPSARGHAIIAASFLQFATANRLIGVPGQYTPTPTRPVQQPNYQNPTSYPSYQEPVRQPSYQGYNYQTPSTSYSSNQQPAPYTADDSNYAGNSNSNYGHRGYADNSNYPSSMGVLPEWGQCGGKSGLCYNGLGKCEDMAWDGQRCPRGQICQRQSEWYWQCLPAGQHYNQPTYQQPSSYINDNYPQPAYTGNYNQQQSYTSNNNYNQQTETQPTAPSYSYYKGPQQAPSYSEYYMNRQGYQPTQGQLPRKALQA